jgi:hypothetical protein
MMEATWRYAAASAIGTSHIRTGLPCQDRFACISIRSATDGDILTAVISDGAGSAAKAELGAEVVCSVASDTVRAALEAGYSVDQFDEDTAHEWLRKIRSALTTLSESEGCALRDLACTMLLAIVGKDAAFFVQLGDGAIVIDGEEASDLPWRPVIWPQHGQYANTTMFVTDDGAHDHLEIVTERRRVTEIAVFSDGIENLALNKAQRTASEAFFEPMLASVRPLLSAGEDRSLSDALAAFLASPRVCDRTDDDKSLILATRRPMTVQSVAD